MLRAHCKLISPEQWKMPEFVAAIQHWIRSEGLWWATSVTAHALILSIAMLIAGAIFSVPKSEARVATFEAANVDTSIPQIESLESIDSAVQPETIDPRAISLGPETLAEPIQMTGDDAGLDSSPVLSGPPLGGPGMFEQIRHMDRRAWRDGPGGVGSSMTGGGGPGSGGPGSFDQRQRRGRNIGTGATQTSERAVARALNWIARHQNLDGSWSLHDFSTRCKDATCTGPAQQKLDCAATALALLPFLAAGQTHMAKGPYQKTVRAGLYWLQQQQASDGDLTGSRHMYSQGLATIVLCEAYGLTQDAAIAQAAVRAIQFIERAQHPQTGGWRYKPGDEGDTSVLGWQLMALKSAQMAGLPVSSQALAGAQRWLKSVGNGQGQFSYVPAGGASPAMCAVGLLCTQYLGAPRQAPELQGGTAYLLAHLPDPGRRDLYYWYYATQVMHNLPGPEWDAWNRSMRRILIDSQATRGCAAGSWDPAQPTTDTHGAAGGRLMMTSLGALTLEVYYRYLPLYQLDRRAMR